MSCKILSTSIKRLLIFTLLVAMIFFTIGYYTELKNLNNFNKNLKCNQNLDVTKLFKKYNLYRILSNNLYAILILVFGGFTFGLLTFICLAYNSYLLGTLVSCIYVKYGYSVVFLLLIPHGIFEIPAVIIAGAAGFKIPYEIVIYLMGKKKQPLTKEDIKEYFILVLLSIILIVIAAWIEANVTLKIAQIMLNSSLKVIYCPISSSSPLRWKC